MLPLGAADTWRIHKANNNQIATQIAQQTQQFQQIKKQLNQVTTDEQLKQLVASLAPQGPHRQMLISFTFAGVFFTLGKLSLDPNAGNRPVKPFAFTDVVPLPGWQLLESRPLAEPVARAYLQSLHVA